MLARDHYATLGVPPTATAEEIEEAYRHLSRRYHPDVNPGNPHAAVVFERLQEAYDVLSDQERRARYDRQGSLTEAADVAFDLQVKVLPDSDDRSSYAELFRRLKEHARRSRPTRGADVHATVTIPLAQVERGRRVAVSVHRRRACAACGGRGRVQLQRTRPCERCNGVGEETFVRGALSVSCPCSDCAGEGLISGVACERCHGRGLCGQQERALVRIPPGVIDGQLVRVPGGGDTGSQLGPAGDLVVRVHVQEMAGYRRQGPHLHTTARISVQDAILGADIEVPTLDGDLAILRLPPGTQNGREFRVRNRGLSMSDSRRGDMLVRVEIRVPEVVDQDSRRLIRDFAERNPLPPDPAADSAT